MPFLDKRKTPVPIGAGAAFLPSYVIQVLAAEPSGLCKFRPEGVAPLAGVFPAAAAFIAADPEFPGVRAPAAVLTAAVMVASAVTAAPVAASTSTPTAAIAVTAIAASAVTVTIAVAVTAVAASAFAVKIRAVGGAAANDGDVRVVAVHAGRGRTAGDGSPLAVIVPAAAVLLGTPAAGAGSCRGAVGRCGILGRILAPADGFHRASSDILQGLQVALNLPGRTPAFPAARHKQFLLS